MRDQDPFLAKKRLFQVVDVILNNSLRKNYISIASISNSEWEDFVVAEAKRLVKEDCGGIAEIEPVFEPDLSLAKDRICAALCTIARYDPEMFSEIKQHVWMIKIFCGKITMGFTDMRILGAMLIRLPAKVASPVMYFVEHIVHEASHIHLNCLMAIDPLILNSPDDRYISPLRTDLRPMMGVFHAMYVSAKIARTFMKLYLGTGNNKLLQPLAETLDETIRGIAEIEKNAQLTFMGQSLLASVKEFIDSAKLLPEWKQYNFSKENIHRYGVGATKVAAFHQLVV